MRELYLSILGAFIRFWDNRFNSKDCKSCIVLQAEVARLQDLNSSLIDRLLNPVTQPADVEGADVKLDSSPNIIKRNQVPWEVKRRELEMSHRRVSENSNSKSGNDLETFERNLEELTK
jgi:secreted Zn-dependent insulinase-like peptidase